MAMVMTTMIKMIFFMKYDDDDDGGHYFRYQVMLNCWQKEPDDRPSFEQLRRELKQMENQHKVI